MPSDPDIVHGGENPISRESAEEQVQALYDAFEMDRQLDPDDEKAERYFPSMCKAVEKGRLDINNEGDEVKVIQRFREAPKGRSETTIEWKWRKLGLAKSRLGMNTDKGVELYNMGYKIGAVMMGIDIQSIYALHPNDLSLVEVIGGFFQKI